MISVSFSQGYEVSARFYKLGVLNFLSDRGGGEFAHQKHCPGVLLGGEGDGQAWN